MPEVLPSSSTAPDSSVVAAADVIASALGEEIVILNLKTGVYHGVEGVAAFIWRLIAQPISIVEICQKVLAEYDVEPQRARREVQEHIAELLASGLAEVAHAPAA